MTLGQRLRQLREQAGLTQRELAQKAHMRQATISQLETGYRKDPKARLLLPLAKFLGTTVEYLMTGKEAGRQDQRRSPHARLAWKTVRA